MYSKLKTWQKNKDQPDVKWNNSQLGFLMMEIYNNLVRIIDYHP